MLDHEWVRKLTDRCGSRFGASRSAMRSTPPRLGVWARASVVDRVGSTAASSTEAYTARGRRPIASSPSDHVGRSRSDREGTARTTENVGLIMRPRRPLSIRAACHLARRGYNGAKSGIRERPMPRTPLEPRFQVEYLSVLDAEGSLDSALDPGLPPAELKRLYRAMLLGRRLDERMVRLQRQGRIGTFAPIKGQEASQLGSVAVLRPTDWMVPSFRETAAMIWRGWPLKKQTNSKTIAQKALAYGLPGIQVDGNDVLAVYAASREAVARARAGDGPTLIECVTYRLGVHTTADDPTKYRSTEEVAEWERRDPLTRFAAYLKKKRLLDEGLEAAVDEEIAAAVARFEATGAADPLVMFDHVYAELPPDLKAQREALAEGLRSGEPGRREKHEPSPPMRGQRSGKR